MKVSESRKKAVRNYDNKTYIKKMVYLQKKDITEQSFNDFETYLKEKGESYSRFVNEKTKEQIEIIGGIKK